MSAIVCDVLDRVTPDEAAAIADLLRQLSPSAPLAPDLAALEREDATLIVARAGGRLVGMGSLAIVHTVSGRRARIEDVVVHDEFRGRGIGEAIVRALVEVARGAGVKTIELSSNPAREAANALYQKVGFEPRRTNVYQLKLPGR